MVTVDERRGDITRTIALNPTTITIKYEKRKEVDGAWQVERGEHQLTVRLFEQKSPEVIMISEKKGTANTTKKYGMLADYKANLQDVATEDLTFETPYGDMKVLGIYPQIARGQICGYQCDLKRVT